MASDNVQLEGIVEEVCRGRQFRVKIKHGGSEHIVLAYLSGKMAKFNISIVVGDKVMVEFSPHSLDKGRIVFRNK